MPTFTMSGLSEVKERQPLCTGAYSLEIGQDTKVIQDKNGNYKLQIESMVTDGPVQPDGTDPQGRRTYDFFQLTGVEGHKDHGVYAMTRLKNFLEAAGIEVQDTMDYDEVIEDLRGTTVIGKNTVKADLSGEPTENWRKYQAG